MADAAVEAPYRAGWVRILRQLSIYTATRYVAGAFFLLSFAGFLSKAPLQGIALAIGLVALGTRFFVYCPRCKARWPSTADADGLRKPCSKCGLRWGQEEDEYDLAELNSL